MQTEKPVPRDDALFEHHQELTTRAGDQHDVLTIAIEALDHALAEAAFHREQPWSQRAAKALDKVREAVSAHAQGVEEPEGLFDEITAVGPHLGMRVDALRNEHESLAMRASALANGLTSKKIEVGNLRSEAAALSSDLRAHRAAEADLIYEAFWIELGGG